MNLATFVTLVIVVLILAGAAYNLYHMVRRNDLCYACPNSGNCGCSNPINCSIRCEDEKK